MATVASVAVIYWGCIHTHVLGGHKVHLISELCLPGRQGVLGRPGNWALPIEPYPQGRQ